MNSANRSIPKIWTIGLLSGAAVIAVLASGPAQAQNPEEAGDKEKSSVRYDRESKKTKAKSDLLNTKFDSAKKEEESKQKRNTQLMSGSDFANKRSAVEQELADKQIEFLKKLIKTTDASDAEYPDLLFRLADHHLEKKAFFDLQAGAMYDQIYAAEDAGDKAKAKELEKKQAGMVAKAKEASGQAARVYEALVKDPRFNNYKRLDEALYYYAFELGVLGEETKMQEAYKRLINDFPNSVFLSQAYLAFADYYYGRGDIQSAVRLYTKVLEFKDSPVYAYALYKLAWCHLNPIGTAEPRYDLSLNFFIQTIKATTEGRAGSEEAGKQLRRDARRDLVRAYVFASKPSEAKAFFEKWGIGPNKDENDSRKMMELLANQYFGNGMYTESTYVYKQLQNLYADDAATCDWQGRIVINTLATDNKEVQWNETKGLADYYSKFKDSDFKKSVKKKCKDDALNTIKQMATVWHDEADKTKIDRTFELAENAYGVFLATFPGDKDGYELQFYYAELLWSLAEKNYSQKDNASKEKGKQYFLKAHDQFVATVMLDPKGKYTRDAAFAQMLAMKNALEYDETGGKSKACKTNSEGVCTYKEEKKKKTKKDKDSKVDAASEYPESDYTDDEKKMLEAYDLYTKYVSDKEDEELPKIMYHRAKLAMEHNRFGDARPLIEEILAKFDGSVYAAWCSEMLLDLLTIRWVDKNNNPAEVVKASEDLETWSKKLQEMKVWKHPEADEIREAVPRLLAGIGWKKGSAQRDSGAAYINGEPGGDPDGFSKCAETFIQVFNDFEDHPKADTLLWNAGECLDAAYKVGQSIQIRKILLEQFPNSQHAKDSLHYLGGSYQAVAYYGDAATRYEEFAAKYKSDARSPEALQNAYLFRLGLGQEEQAAADLKAYEDIYKQKDPATAARIFWSRYALLTTDVSRKKHAEDYLKIYGKKGGTDRQIVAEVAIGQILWRESCEKELLYDSCLSIKRKKAVSAAKEIEKRKKMEAKLAKMSAKDKKALDKKKEAEDKRPDIPERCGTATQGVVTVYKRDKSKAEAAQSRFKGALKLAAGGTQIPQEDVARIDEFKNAWGMAMVYAADQKYEEYLKINMPEELDFFVEEYKKDSGYAPWEKQYKEQLKRVEDSKKRVKEFFDKKMALGKELQTAYAEVKKTGSPYWTLAAAARTGMVLQNFADQLYRAEVPKTIKTEDAYFAYCDALGEFADPVSQQALEAFEYCIERSTEFQFFNDFSRLCEEEMQQNNADKYPATNELFGNSIYTASRVKNVGVLSNPAGETLNVLRVKKQAAGGSGSTTPPPADADKGGDDAEGEDGGE